MQDLLTFIGEEKEIEIYFNFCIFSINTCWILFSPFQIPTIQPHSAPSVFVILLASTHQAMKAKKAPCQNPLRSAGGHLESDLRQSHELDDVWHGYIRKSPEFLFTCEQKIFWPNVIFVNKETTSINIFILNFLFWPQHFGIRRFLVLVMNFLELSITFTKKPAFTTISEATFNIQEVWEMIHLILGWIALISGHIKDNFW